MEIIKAWMITEITNENNDTIVGLFDNKRDAEEYLIKNSDKVLFIQEIIMTRDNYYHIIDNILKL